VEKIMKKTALLILFFTLLTKIFGFLREVTLSYAYGANAISDAYVIAYTIPGVIFAFLGTSIATSFIPIYTDIFIKKGEAEANLFINNIINLFLILSLIVATTGFIFAQPLVKAFASGFKDEILDMAVKFTRISIFGILISIMIHILSAYLNIKGDYYSPVIAGIPFNIIITAFILLSLNFGLFFLPLGIIFALLFQLIFITVFSKKKGFTYKFYFCLNDPNIRKIISLSLPVIIGVSVNQINVLVDRTIASTLVVGGISALNYSNKLITFIQGIIVTPVSTVIYPAITQMAAYNETSELKRVLRESMLGINILIIPITVGAIVLASPLVNFVFGRGAFDEQANVLTSAALKYYSIGMLGFGLREVLSRVFYSMQDTKTPMINAAIGVIINIILNLTLSRFLGIGGLALATSISAITMTILMVISLRGKIGPYGMRQISKTFVKIIFASLLMALIVKLIFNFLIDNFMKNISLILAIGFGVLSYAMIIYFMKIEEVEVLIDFVKKKIKKGSGKSYI